MGELLAWIDVLSAHGRAIAMTVAAELAAVLAAVRKDRCAGFLSGN